MTLKELNDASHPLLQRLAQEAPGTYQHSLRIADMAEAAADTIGADGLFCRVGAMYHDIGKINKPMYFIENQGGGPNRHDKLTPAMSLLIIVGHVKDGIEMAREYGLPPTLRHFIESHHGTTLVEYFYHAAKKQTSEQDKPEPSEFEFRYPGPKPQTKEAAIMLLCDGIEGAARALPEPTPVRLEQVVNNMARKRLMDGQFDECNLTLSELHRIEKSIVKTLCAVYHGRIAYPGGESKGRTQTRRRRQCRRLIHLILQTYSFLPAWSLQRSTLFTPHPIPPHPASPPLSSSCMSPPRSSNRKYHAYREDFARRRKHGEAAEKKAHRPRWRAARPTTDR